MNWLGKIGVKLGLDSKGFEQGADKAEGRLDKFGQSVKRLGGLLAGAFAVNQITAFVNRSVAAYRVQEQAERKLESVLRATGNSAGFTADQLKEYASQLQRVTTFGDEVTINAIAVAAAFQNIRGDNFKTLIALSQDLATVLGYDLTSATRVLGRALEAPQRGLSQLRRIGITFTKEQTASVKELVEAGKTQEAQQILINAVTERFGGAARDAANTATSYIERIKNAWGDVVEQMGQAIVENRIIIGLLQETLHLLQDSYRGESIIKEWIEENITNAGLTAEQQIEKTRESLDNLNERIKGYPDPEQSPFVRGLKNVGNWLAGALTAGNWDPWQLRDANFDRAQRVALQGVVDSINLQEQVNQELERINLRKKTIAELEALETYWAGVHTEKAAGVTQAIKNELQSRYQQEEALRAQQEEAAKKAAEAAAKARQEAYKRYSVDFLSEETEKNLAFLKEFNQGQKNTIFYLEQELALRRQREKFATSDEEFQQLKKENDELERQVELRKMNNQERWQSLLDEAKKDRSINTYDVDQELSSILYQNLKDLDATLNATDGAYHRIKEQTQRIQQLTEDLRSAIAEGLGSAIEEFATSLIQLGTLDISGVIAGLITPLADVAIQQGKIIIASGQAIEALKSSLINFFGGSSIVAGAALIAIGSAAKAAFGNLARNAGSSSTGYSNTFTGGYSTGGVSALNNLPQTQAATLNIAGEFRIEGRDLVAVLNKEESRRSR